MIINHMPFFIIPILENDPNYQHIIFILIFYLFQTIILTKFYNFKSYYLIHPPL